MVQRTPQALAALYEADETAWLDQTAELVRSRLFDQLDPDSLAEYLEDMSGRDRREVYSRLVVLLTHLLKWEFQPERRGGSWRTTVRTQRRELAQILASKVLHAHAEAVYADAYADARLNAADETGLDPDTFPAEAVPPLDEALTSPLAESES